MKTLLSDRVEMLELEVACLRRGLRWLFGIVILGIMAGLLLLLDWLL